MLAINVPVSIEERAKAAIVVETICAVFSSPIICVISFAKM